MGGVIGTLQAAEAIKYLLGMEGLAGYLLTYNAMTMDFRKVKLAPNNDCQVCGENPGITTLIDYEQAVCDLH
jgi:molybdopterin/thiamine biosynthesis adenylyltransferase